MKKLFFIWLCLINLVVNAQFKKDKSIEHRFTKSEKYFSFNPLGLLEPQIAVGFGAGIRLSNRSEFFTELAYLGRNPTYKYDNLVFYNGVRFLAQYRYHFLQQWKPLINLGSITRNQRERRRRNQTFIAVEFRFKPATFSSYNSFMNATTAGRLDSFKYKANAQSVGGAILFGETVNLNKKGNWLLEITFGIGGKQKFVKYKNLPQGYTVVPKQPREWNFVPDIDEVIGVPYIPSTLRLRYLIR